MKYKFLFLTLFLFPNFLIAQESTSLRDSVTVAVQRTERYFAKTNKDFNSQLLLVLAAKVEQLYACKTQLTIVSKLNKPPVFDDEKTSIIFLKRILGKKEKLTREQLNAKQGLEKLLNWSLAADVFRIDKEYAALLNNQSQFPDRNTAHTSLCLAWLRDLNQLRYLPNSDSIICRHVALMTTMLHREPIASDNQLEAMMALMVLQQQALISDSIIAAVIRHQNRDGGWAFEQVGNAPSHAHPTLLAYWVLQDYLHAGTKLAKWF